MSILSNHYPEVLDELNGTACTCPPDGQSVDDMCPACQSDYQQWAASQEEPMTPAAYDALVETLPEPCGQQFPDDLDLPF